MFECVLDHCRPSPNPTTCSDTPSSPHSCLPPPTNNFDPFFEILTFITCFYVFSTTVNHFQGLLHAHTCLRPLLTVFETCRSFLPLVTYLYPFSPFWTVFSQIFKPHFISYPIPNCSHNLLPIFELYHSCFAYFCTFSPPLFNLFIILLPIFNHFSPLQPFIVILHSFTTTFYYCYDFKRLDNRQQSNQKFEVQDADEPRRMQVETCIVLLGLRVK